MGLTFKAAALVLLVVLVFAAEALGQIAASNGGRGQVQQVHVCKRKLAALADPVIMSRQTARRISYDLCRKLRDGSTDQRYLYRAIIRK